MEFHLAPLKNISCWAFRAGIPGATDVYTEMIHLKGIRTNPDKFWQELDTFSLHSTNVHQWVQLLTNNPRDIIALIREVSLYCERYPLRSDIYGFNINLGCPDPHIMAEGLGACQLKQITQVKKLINIFLSTDHHYHLSLKIRLGESNQDMVENSFLQILDLHKYFNDPRLSPTIIHFKHAQQSSSEPCRWEMLEPILDLEVPFVINGHISAPNDFKNIKNSLPRRYLALWDKYVKGIMVGRGVLKDPLCLTEFDPHFKQITPGSWKEEMKKLIAKYPVEERFKKNLNTFYGLKI